MEKILKSDYDNFHDLVRRSGIYSKEQLQETLETIMGEWENNRITLAVLNAKIKFIYSYLEQKKISITFKNQTPFPIGFFSSFLRLNAAYLYSYLNTKCINVRLFKLSEEKGAFKDFIKLNKPYYSIFTLSQFHYIDYLKHLIPFLFNQNIKIILGGKVFEYDEQLRSEFPNCIFPNSIDELIALLNHKVNEDLK
jgi:hypothetical protein